MEQSYTTLMLNRKSSYQVQSTFFQCPFFHPCDIAHGESRVCAVQPLLSSPRIFRCTCSHRSHRSPSSALLSSVDLVYKHHNHY